MSVHNVDILYSDDDIVVAVKPASTDSQKTAGGSDMVRILSEMTGGDIFPVHRLDRETRGVMVYARTHKAASSLSESFSRGFVEKAYLTVILGAPEEESGEYRDLLYHDSRRNKSYVVSCQRRSVRDAHLRYCTVARSGQTTLVAVRPVTGRTHQIRVQFASRGTPVLGDRRYGGKPDDSRWGADIESFRGIALACVSLSFPHPSGSGSVSFSFTPTGAPWDSFDLSSVPHVIAEL